MLFRSVPFACIDGIDDNGSGEAYVRNVVDQRLLLPQISAQGPSNLCARIAIMITMIWRRLPATAHAKLKQCIANDTIALHQ